MHRKPRTAAVHVLAALVLVVGVLAFLGTGRTVTVTVDGVPREVRTFAWTVGSALERSGIAVGERDLVTPEREAPIGDGATIEVRTARPFVVDLDGRGPTTVWTTAGTVDEALTSLGVRADAATLTVSRSQAIPREGLAVVVRTPRLVDVLVDGKRRSTTTTATTVREVLNELNVRLGSRDEVSPALDAATTDGQIVEVTRVTTRQRTVTAKVRFRTIERRSAEYFVGYRKVVRAGEPGVVVRVLGTRVANGKPGAERVVSQRFRAKPIDAIVVVGTRPVPRSSDAVARLNWAALAKCESGGRPTARSRNGLYYGLYQFLPSTWRAVGGRGLPSDASPAEQTFRAQKLFRVANWRTQWPVCGVNLFR